MKIYVVLVITALIVHETKCGVIGSVYGEISNRTQAVKDDVYSWWSYSVDTVLGSEDDSQYVKNIKDNAGEAIDKTKAEVEKQSGIISGMYNKVKGGVTYGYMKVHDVVLGKDSDPNKGIIRTLYERAMHRLSQIKLYIFGDDTDKDQPESQDKEDNRDKVLKVLFGNNTDLFKDENERRALESLRRKLTEAGDHALQLADNEREVIKKAYESIRNKSDGLTINTNNSANKIKDKVQENIDKTREFIKDESGKVSEGAQKLGNDVQKSVNDMEMKFASSELSKGAQNVGEEVKKSFDDMEKTFIR